MSIDVLPITGVPVGGISPNVIVCGDPARAEKIAKTLQGSTLIAERREYRSFIGDYNGLPITVCSHGVGAPGAAIAFEELIVAGARRLLRVGTCGSFQREIIDGDLVIATAAVQNTGYVREVAPQGYPAVADPQLTITLGHAARHKGINAHSGIVLTRDAFYSGVQAPDLPDYSIMSEANVLAVEMECAALFTVGSLRGVSTAAILAVDGNLVTNGAESVDSYKPYRDVVDRAIEAAIVLAAQALHDAAQEV
ncbi:MAG: nucleoside phosphorylase [Candidatus Promineifilaceae bacterium]|jgi:uridine phosphorylase